MSDRERDTSRSSLAQLMKSYREISPFLGLGLQLAVSILVFLFIGRWIDGQLDTYPVFMIIGAFLGAAGGMISFIRAVIKSQDKKSKNKNEV